MTGVLLVNGRYCSASALRVPSAVSASIAWLTQAVSLLPLSRATL